MTTEKKEMDDLVVLLSSILGDSLRHPKTETGQQQLRLHELLNSIGTSDIPAVQTRLAADGSWNAASPLYEMRMLRSDSAASHHSMLVRLKPGAEIPAHLHPTEEETLVVEGEITVGGETLRSGDFQVAPAGSKHAVIRSSAGAVLLIRYQQPKTVAA